MSFCGWGQMRDAGYRLDGERGKGHCYSFSENNEIIYLKNYINLSLEYPISNTEQQSRNQFCSHGTHGIHRKRLTTKHTNHTKKTIVNFLLRKNLTIDFVENVQKKQEYDGLYYGMSNNEVKTKCIEN